MAVTVSHLFLSTCQEVSALCDVKKGNQIPVPTLFSPLNTLGNTPHLSLEVLPISHSKLAHWAKHISFDCAERRLFCNIPKASNHLLHLRWLVLFWGNPDTIILTKSSLHDFNSSRLLDKSSFASVVLVLSALFSAACPKYWIKLPVMWFDANGKKVICW